MRPLALMALLPLAACQRLPDVDALARDPARLQAFRAQCRAGEHDAAFCARVSQADLRRFLSGQTGADEYRTLGELPPIPPTFDEPVAGAEGRP